MENSHNSTDFNTSGGGNPKGGTPGGGPSHENEMASFTSTDESNRVRRSNAMNFTQMCTGTDIEPLSPETLSKESLQKVHEVLVKERAEFWNNSPHRRGRAVNIGEIGYHFGSKTGTVMPELMVLRNTDSLSNLAGETNVKRVIDYCERNM